MTDTAININMNTETNLSIKEKNIVKINDNKIKDVALKLSDKMGIPVEKAETEVKIGIINALLLNRHWLYDKRINNEK